jgi:hypothetical protein
VKLVKLFEIERIHAPDRNRIAVPIYGANSAGRA